MGLGKVKREATSLNKDAIEARKAEQAAAAALEAGPIENSTPKRVRKNKRKSRQSGEIYHGTSRK